MTQRINFTVYLDFKRMNDILKTDDIFLQELIEIIDQQLSDESFGVSELAEKASMSRSNLLRKIQKSTGFSASVFIRKVRLARAQVLLQTAELNVSEASYKVGFGSPSYFVKCYREEYGYPPGEEKDRATNTPIEPTPHPSQSSKTSLWYAGAVLAALLSTWLLFFYPASKPEALLEKSIVVLPFQNDSNDSSNVYFINGMMEAILNNLQKVEDLRVISRTTAEKYRNSGKTIPEIAKELDVAYFIEGSGQKLGDQVLLTVQLIKAKEDEHIWSEQYRRQIRDIFELQADVAKEIASQVEAKISPEEIQRIEKVLTSNLVAYDHYLKGVEAINQESFEGIDEGIIEFKKALMEDSLIAEAYAFISIGYYYDDFYRGRKQNSAAIDLNAQKAYELDPNSSLSLTAKGLGAMHAEDYENAITYFEKVLDINPNSARAYNHLSDIHTNYLPNPRKYLEYALKGVKIDMAGQDSSILTFSYLHLSNALAQTGFLKLSEEFAKKSIALDSTNLFSQYLLAYILFAQDEDYATAEKSLLAVLKKDTTRLDIIQEVAKLNYAEGDYETAAIFYDKMNEIKDAFDMDLFDGENVKVAYVYEQVGRPEDAEIYYNRYKAYAMNDESKYAPLSQAAFYASQNMVDEGIAHLKEFTDVKGIPYWFIIFIKDDPILGNLNDHPDYEKVLQLLEDNFWKEHDEIEEELSTAKVLINR